MKEFRYRTLNVNLFILFLIPCISILLPCLILLMITITQNVWLIFIVTLTICTLPALLSLEEIKVVFIKDKIKIMKKRLINQSSYEKEISLSDIMLVQLTYIKAHANGSFKYGHSLLYSPNRELVILYFYLSIYAQGQQVADIKLTPPFTSAGRKEMYDILFVILNSGSYILSDRLGYTEFVNEDMLDSEASIITNLKSNKTIFKTIAFIVALLVILILCILFTINVLLPCIS